MCGNDYSMAIMLDHRSTDISFQEITGGSVPLEVSILEHCQRGCLFSGIALSNLSALQVLINEWSLTSARDHRGE